MRFITYIFGCILLLSGISLKAQERNLFKKKTEIEVKSNSQLFQEKNKKKDDLDELPPLQFRNETESIGVTAGSEMQERKFEPIKALNASISNFDTTSIDEGENLIVEIEEEAAPEGTEDFVSVASYFAIWDTKIIDPYDIDAKEFDEPVDIELYNTAAGRNWAAPLEIVKQTSPFGPRWGRLHAGVDLDLETGYPVYSVFDGIVRVSHYDRSGYGNYVVVRHYNGFETLYGHLASPGAEPGTIVKAGDQIGVGGNTGRSTGSHLHFETRYEGNPMNPKNVYNFNPFEPVSDHIIITARSFDIRSLSLKNEYGSVGDKVRSRTKAWTKVRQGDTLGAIARRTGVSIAKLKKLNGMKSSCLLYTSPSPRDYAASRMPSSA